MNYFISYELLDPTNGYKVLFVGAVVITASMPDSVMADLEAIKNDHALPDSSIRVLCLTILPSQ